MAPSDDLEQLTRGFSVRRCLAHHPSAAIGTLPCSPLAPSWRPEAGSRAVRRLLIEHHFWFFYHPLP